MRGPRRRRTAPAPKSVELDRRRDRTYNFTTEAENADPLFVFHQNVEKARTKLAAGSTGGGGSAQGSRR